MKLTKFKKATTLLLATVLLGSTLAGCGTKENITSPPVTNGKEEVAKTAEVTNLTVELFDRGNATSDPVDDNMWTKYIRKGMLEKHAVNVDYAIVPRGKEVDQLNVLMAADNAPDIIFTYSEDLALSYAKDGGLADLGPAIEEYGPNIKRVLGDVLKFGQYEGVQIAVPARRTLKGGQVTYMRKDWLDAVGLDAPKTTEEFYNALKAFKEQDPGKLGAENVIPMQMQTYGHQMLIESFAENYDEETLFVNGGISLDRPGIKEGYRFINTLINEGLANMDYILDKDNVMQKEQFVNGKIGAWTVNQGLTIDLIPELVENVPGAEIIAVDTFTNPAGEIKKTGQKDSGMFIMVPKASEEKVAEAVKYIDFLCEDDVVFFLQNGEEGVHHTIVDGIPQAISEAVEADFLSGNNGDMLITFNGKWLGNLDDSIRASASGYPGYEDLYIDSYKVSDSNRLPVIIYPRPLETAAKYTTAITYKMDEFSVRVFTVKPAEFDTVYDEATNEILKAGAQEMKDEAQALWDEFN